MTKIEKLGLEEKIIGDKKKGLPLRDIAKKYNLSKGSIEHFLNSKYITRDIQKPLTKRAEKTIEVTNSSIFEISGKLEELHKKLIESENDFEKDSINKIFWFKEFREQIKLAATLVKQIISYEEAKKFRQILVEEIGKESKDVQQRIIRRIYSFRRVE